MSFKIGDKVKVIGNSPAEESGMMGILLGLDRFNQLIGLNGVVVGQDGEFPVVEFEEDTYPLFIKQIRPDKGTAMPLYEEDLELIS